MSGWKRFWDGLNIRKCVMLFVCGMYAYVLVANSADMGVKDMFLMCVSYYFGYSNSKR